MRVFLGIIIDEHTYIGIYNIHIPIILLHIKYRFLYTLRIYIGIHI